MLAAMFAIAWRATAGVALCGVASDVVAPVPAIHPHWYLAGYYHGWEGRGPSWQPGLVIALPPAAAGAAQAGVFARPRLFYTAGVVRVVRRTDL